MSLSNWECWTINKWKLHKLNALMIKIVFRLRRFSEKTCVFFFLSAGGLWPLDIIAVNGEVPSKKQRKKKAELVVGTVC